jgi:hypothetical protein
MRVPRAHAARVAIVTGTAGGRGHLNVTSEKPWSDVLSAPYRPMPC